MAYNNVAWGLRGSGLLLAVLLIINLFLLAVGTLLDTASASLVLTPLLAPIALVLDLGLVHFGIIVVVNLSIGTFSPPLDFTYWRTGGL